MEKNNTILIGVLVLIVGLFVGYFIGVDRTEVRFSRGGWNSFGMMGGMMNYMDEDDYEFMGQMMQGMMGDFAGLSGVAYEEAFLRHMIVHHEGAVIMAQELLKNTTRPELVELADNIINTQTQEIETMESWLSDWFE